MIILSIRQNITTDEVGEMLREVYNAARENADIEFDEMFEICEFSLAPIYQELAEEKEIERVAEIFGKILEENENDWFWKGFQRAIY